MISTDIGARVTIRTSHGEIEVNSADIIHFPEGLIGFENYREFVIFDLKDCYPFKSMLSVHEGGPDFVVLEPLRIFDDYLPFVSRISSPRTDMERSDNMVLLSIVTLAERPEDITVNLRGPIVLDLKSRSARQVVIPDDHCSTKMPLLARS